MYRSIVLTIGASLILGLLNLASSGQNIKVPFVVPARAALVVGVPNLQKFTEHLSPYQSSIQSVVPLLLCTDVHSGEEVQAEWTKEKAKIFPDSPDLNGVSVWMVLDDCSTNIGEVALVIVHPGLTVSETQKKITAEFIRSVFSFLPKMAPRRGGVGQAKLFEKLFQWEQNHILVCQSGATVIASSETFAKKLQVVGSGSFVNTQRNRSFVESVNFCLPNSDIVCFISPANSQSIAVGAGFVRESEIKRFGYRYKERPWLIFSARIEAGETKKIEYRCIARTTLPFSGRDVGWTAYKKIRWVPDLPNDFQVMSAVHKDLALAEKLFTEYEPEMVAAIRNSPVLAWEWGLGRPEVGGLSFGFNWKGARTVNLKFLASGANREEVVMMFDNYYSKYSDEAMRLGRGNLFGGNMVRGDRTGFPVWVSSSESTDPRIAVLTNDSVYEGPSSLFDQIQRTADGNQTRDSVLIPSVERMVKENGLDGSIVQFSVDKKSNVSVLLGYYINFVLSVFQEHSYHDEDSLLASLNSNVKETKRTRYQKLVKEVATVLHSLKSKQIEHVEVHLFDAEIPIWKVLGRFEFKESTDGDQAKESLQ